jgi:hypothetical protein
LFRRSHRFHNPLYFNRKNCLCSKFSSGSRT